MKSFLKLLILLLAMYGLLFIPNGVYIKVLITLLAYWVLVES